MTPTACQARSRSLSVLCLIAVCAPLLLAGCGGGGNNGGGGGGNGGGGGTTTNYTVSVASTNPASGVAISYGNTVTSLLATGTTAFTV